MKFERLAKTPSGSSLPNYTLVLIRFSPRIVAILGFFAGSLEQSQETFVASNAANLFDDPYRCRF